ncbi:MAG: NAD(P)-dependent oxidoreductase [Amycolatopsis sp.]|uniref:NAD(P)H-binding protein n=1 Tax=Amycolatopsis sp. TaxID=37632 RepID=UPI00260BCEC1|nr:NAD(P)H-binding protein [Amycolatopsis sp.]MCU1683624.1 NAD(P)-dependent oxidoreductase [Amycolatopsis sp.]
MILITGATGTVGRELVVQLLPSGIPLRAMTRDPSRADFPESVEVVAGDLAQPSLLLRALKAVDQVFLLFAGPNSAEHDANLIAAALEAGSPHIVKLSALSIARDAKDPISTWHQAGEQALRDSGLTWTFLRPGAFMSNALRWAGSISSHDSVYAPYGEGRAAVIDPADIAAAAVAALTGLGHENTAYSLTGPAALSPGEQVEILSEVLDRPLRFIPVPESAALDGMLKAGMPPIVADATMQTMAIALEPAGSQLEPTVEQLAGRPARTFAEWAQAHRAAFG